MVNVYFERLMLVKANGLMTSDKLLQVATVFFTWGKIDENEYDVITSEPVVEV